MIAMAPVTEPSLPLVLPSSLAVEAFVPSFLAASGAVSLEPWITESEEDPDDKRREDQNKSENLYASVVRR